MLAISRPMSFGLFSSPPHSARLTVSTMISAGFAAVAARQILERGDDVGGGLRVAEIERPADHLERQLALQWLVFDAQGDGATGDHAGAFQRDVEHRALFHLAAVPRAAGGDVQAEVLDQPTDLPEPGSPYQTRHLADGEEMMDEPDLLAGSCSGRQIRCRAGCGRCVAESRRAAACRCRSSRARPRPDR